MLNLKVVQKKVLFYVFVIIICLSFSLNVRASGKDYMYGRNSGDGHDGKTLTKWNFSEEVGVEKDFYAQKFFIEAKPGDELDLPIVFNFSDGFELRDLEGKY